MEEKTDNADAAESATVQTPTTINELRPKMELKGTVKRLELYGAFIDIGVETNGLIHISKLGSGHVNRVADILKEGEEVTVWVEKVNPDLNQIMLTMIEPLAVEWRDLKAGQEYTGTITRLENYGAFIDIGAEREGLVHISEISHDYVNHPNDILQVGSEQQVQVLSFNKRKRRIDLSIKNLLEKPEAAPARPNAEPQFAPQFDEEEEILEEVPTAMEMALRKAMGDESGNAFTTRDGRRRGRSNKSRRREERRRLQEELLSRTLELQSDS